MFQTQSPHNTLNRIAQAEIFLSFKWCIQNYNVSVLAALVTKHFLRPIVIISSSILGYYGCSSNAVLPNNVLPNDILPNDIFA
jgi:hypothetical protein